MAQQARSEISVTWYKNQSSSGAGWASRELPAAGSASGSLTVGTEECVQCPGSLDSSPDRSWRKIYQTKSVSHNSDLQEESRMGQAGLPHKGAGFKI